MTALLTIILSFIGALVCGLMPSSAHRRIRWVALAFAAPDWWCRWYVV